MKEKKGLNQQEVEERIRKGKTNAACDVASKSVKEIVCGNIFTFFNGLNLVLALCVALVHSFRNTLFFGVVFWNAVIGIVQELRAKKELYRKELVR